MKKGFEHPLLSHQSGITVIEAMLITMLFVIFTSIAISVYVHIEHDESPEVIQERYDILRLENAAKLYKLNNGLYPTEQQGLNALSKKPTLKPTPKNWIPYLNSIPKDPWGGDYHYRNPGRFKSIEIFSCRPSGKYPIFAKMKYWFFKDPKINCQ